MLSPWTQMIVQEKGKGSCETREAFMSFLTMVMTSGLVGCGNMFVGSLGFS